MITGFKKKKLGYASERLFLGDIPRAGWRAVIFSEVVFPVFIAILLVVAYMFVKSFPNNEGVYPPSPLIRIAVISFGPIAFNAAILFVLFLVSLCLGPLDRTSQKFGSVIAFIAHILGVTGMLGSFELLVSLYDNLLSSPFINAFSTVVPRVLGGRSCSARVNLHHCHPARCTQGCYCCPLVS